MKFSFFKTRKAQSATEYLMTYGWAILAIAIVGALLYTQVFSTKKCAEGATGFPMTGSVAVDEYSITAGSASGLLNVMFENNVGKAIILDSVDHIDSSGTIVQLYAGGTPATDALPDGNPRTLTSTTAVPGATGSTAGDCYSDKIVFTYRTCSEATCTGTISTVIQKASGTLSGTYV